jgi:hypothetical protein
LKIFQEAVAKRFKITVSKDVKEYLGISMEMLPVGDCRLIQPKLRDSVLEEYKGQLYQSWEN